VNINENKIKINKQDIKIKSLEQMVAKLIEKDHKIK